MQTSLVPSLTEGRISRYSVRVGSAVFDKEELYTCEAAYDKDGSGVLSFSVEDFRGELPELVGSDVSFFYGYEDEPLIEWFTGSLAWADESESSGLTEAEAFGPLKVMQGQYFDEPERYTAVSIGNFFADIRNRMHDRRARIDVIGGQLYTIEDAPFPGETSLYEGIESICEPAGYVYCDRPLYDLLVMPTPRPAIGGSPAAHYSEEDYPPGGLTLNPSKEPPYYKVVVFRRDEAGNEVLRQEALVDNQGKAGPPPNRIWWVADFDGDASNAAQTATDTADSLRFVPYEGKLTGVAANPHLLQYDQVSVKQVKRRYGSAIARGEERTERTYVARIRDISLDALADSMQMSIQALKSSETVIRPREDESGVSPYLVPQPKPPAPVVGEDADGLFFVLPAPEDDQWFGTDAAGEFWIDLNQAYDRAGEDLGGVWIDLDAANNRDESGAT